MKMGIHGGSLAESLQGADMVFVFRPGDVDASFEESLAPLGDRHLVFGDYDELVMALECEVKSGDQVVFMSNGGFGASRQKLTRALQSRGKP